MESNLNKSKLSVIFGDEIGSNQQSSLHVELTLNKQKAQAQALKVKQMILNQVETATSLTFAFPCLEANQDTLINLLEGIFNGTAHTKMSSDIHHHYTAGRITYYFIKNQDKVILVIKPEGELSEIISGQLDFILSTEGMKDVIDNQQNRVLIDAKSINTFSDIEEFMQNGDSFIGALLKSLKFDLTLDIHQDLLSSIIEILQALDPVFASSPIGFLQFFKNFNIDVQFSSSQELPDNIRADLFSKGNIKNGLAVKESSPENDKKFWRSLVGLIEPGVEVYLTLEDVLALHLESNLPGFGGHFTRNIKPEH